MKTCEYCGLGIPNGELHCKGCGAPTPTENPRSEKSKKQPPPTSQAYSQPGVQNPYGTPYQPKQGHPYYEDIQRRTRMEQAAGKRRLALIIFLSAIGFFILMGIVGSINSVRRTRAYTQSYEAPRPVHQMQGKVSEVPPQPLAEGTGLSVPASRFASFRDGNNHYVYAMNGAFTFAGTESVQFKSTVDGRLCFYLAEKEDSYKRDLYGFSTGGESRLIMEDVNDITLCSDSDIVFFQAGQGSTDLYRYTWSKGEAELVGTDVRSFVTSPDGSHILFSNREYVSYMPVGKMPTRLMAADGPTVSSISNDGKVYTFRTDDHSGQETAHHIYFCLVDEDEPQGQISYYGYRSELSLNADGSDVLILSPEGLHRFSAETGLLLLNETGADTLTLAPMPQTRPADGTRMRTYGTSSFASFFYTIQNENRVTTLYYHHSGEDIEVTAVETSMDIVLTSDLRAAYYRANNAVWRADVTETGVEATLVVEDVYRYAVSPNGKTFFYTKWAYDPDEPDTEGDNLYRVDEGGQHVLLDKNVTEMCLGGQDGTACVYIAGGKPYNGIGGAAYLYTPEGGSVHIDDNVSQIGPPTAANAFAYCTDAKAKPGQGYSFLADLHVYDGAESRLLAQQVENRNTYYARDWFYRQDF